MMQPRHRLVLSLLVGFALVLVFLLLRSEGDVGSGSEESVQSDVPVADAKGHTAGRGPAPSSQDLAFDQGRELAGSAAHDPDAVSDGNVGAYSDAAGDEEELRSDPAESSEDILAPDELEQYEDEDFPRSEKPLGRANKKDISQGIQDQMPEIRECYQSWLHQNPNIGGKLKVKFVIASSEDNPDLGRVEKIELEDSTVNHVWMEGCVLSAMEGAEFDPPEGGGVVIVNYPLVFSSEED